MTDMVILGNGNSRTLKSVATFLADYPTYEDFVAALVAGTLPIDLGGIEPAGISTPGTPYNKASVLTDTTAAKFGLGASATPNDAFSALGFYATGTFTAAGWSGTAPYSQTISVSGMKSAYHPGWDINTNSTSAATLRNLAEAAACITYIKTANGSVTAYCADTKPTVDLPVFFRGV